MDKQLKDVYALITARVIEQLQQGIVPWHQPWTSAGLPQNFITRKPYRGINLWLLNCLKYSNNYFLTFRQVQDIGASVRKGEKAHPVVFWRMVEGELDPESNEPTKKPMLRYYMVFNIAQCNGIPENKIPVAHRINNPITTCEEIVETMPNRPEIYHREHEAYYNIDDDYINMPDINTFESAEAYYNTLWHELVHSTGSTGRLNRKELGEKGAFGSRSYAIEELTAEMGACYLSSFVGIEKSLFPNSVAYIQAWLKRLEEDKRLIVYAGSQAQKAVDYILGKANESEAVEPEPKTAAA